MSKLQEKSLRIIEFSGKKDDWKVWSVKWLARANRRGYKKLVNGPVPIPSESQYQSAVLVSEPSTTEKKRVELYEASIEAFEDLILSINGSTSAGRVAFELVHGSRTQDNPDGDVKLAWKRLVSKFEPKTAQSYIKLNKEFVSSKLEDTVTDPEEWITKLEALRTQMNNVKIRNKNDMTETELIIHILTSLPEEYEVAVSDLENKLMHPTEDLNIEEV